MDKKDKIQQKLKRLKENILHKKMDYNSNIYQVLRKTETSYTNHAQIKQVFYNFIYFIKNIYKKGELKFIRNYQRKYYVHKNLKSNFGDNLEEILSKIMKISSIDS